MKTSSKILIASLAVCLIAFLAFNIFIFQKLKDLSEEEKRTTEEVSMEKDLPSDNTFVLIEE